MLSGPLTTSPFGDCGSVASCHRAMVDSAEGAATPKPTKNSRAGVPKRTRVNCHRKEVHSNQRGLQQCTKWSKSHGPWHRGATGFCEPQKITVVTA